MLLTGHYFSQLRIKISLYAEKLSIKTAVPGNVGADKRERWLLGISQSGNKELVSRWQKQNIFVTLCHPIETNVLALYRKACNP